ncbi:MAG: ATP phosphoribosyltransferase regulatory subunit [Clostridia bacterium]|nr:ATP phosphoribosyltransferase regulatory subunit [Clostridia bacterium]
MMKRDEQAVFALRELYEKYGYSRYKMSRFEEYDLYVNNKDFLVSDEVITFTDRSGRLLALKPDVTLSIIKNAPDVKGETQKVYYNENVYRVYTGNSSFREIMQTGLECIGDLGGYEIAEVVLLAAKSLALISDNYLLDISHMGLISALLKNSGLSQKGVESASQYLQSKNSHELTAMCIDEGIDEKEIKKLNALIDYSGQPKSVINSLNPLLTEEKEIAALNELVLLCEILEKCGFGDRISIDFSVGNDLKYYSGVVFKGYIEGLPAGILSGGQYDKLLKKMGRKSKAIGFAVYTDMLERLENKSVSPLDAVILYENGFDARLIEISEGFAKDGSVLVTASLPENRPYKKLYRYEKGEVTLIEDRS